MAYIKRRVHPIPRTRLIENLEIFEQDVRNSNQKSAVPKSPQAMIHKGCRILGKAPPKTHNLIHLMKLGQAKLSKEQTRFITRLSLAGIVTRYPDELKRALSDYHSSVTRDYLKSAKDVIKCLKQQIG